MTATFNRIKMRRIALNLKQKKVAENAGITSQYLYKLESGKAKHPSIEIMKRIAEALETTPQELFF